MLPHDIYFRIIVLCHALFRYSLGIMLVVLVSLILPQPIKLCRIKPFLLLLFDILHPIGVLIMLQ